MLTHLRRCFATALKKGDKIPSAMVAIVKYNHEEHLYEN